MTKNNHDLLRVIYFSHCNMDVTEEGMRWEIDEILEKSQANNQSVNITGALLFNAGVFGQVLEGPIDAVEETFDRIQMDDRHDDITVLDLSRITERSFADWSMGFVGANMIHAELYGTVGTFTNFNVAHLSGQQIFESLHALTLKNEITGRVA